MSIASTGKRHRHLAAFGGRWLMALLFTMTVASSAFGEPSATDPLETTAEHHAASASLKASGIDVTRYQHADGEFATRVSFGTSSDERPKADHLAALKQLDQLREIGLFDLGPVSGPEIELVAALPEVRSLSIQYCQVAKEGFAALAKMHRLEELMLGNCQLRDGNLEFLRSLPNLRSLCIDRYNELSKAGLQPLEATCNLRTLTLQSVPVSDDTLYRLRHNRKLQTLDIVSGHHLTDAGFAALCDGRPLPDLETFRFAYFPATGEFLATLRFTPNLTSLFIDDRGLDRADYANLPELPQLRRLEISTWRADKPASGELIRVAARYKTLEHFRCDVEKVDPEQLQSLGELKDLKSLALERLVLNDAVISELARLPKLNDLTIARVDSSQTTADTLRKLPGVKTVWFYRNFGNTDLMSIADLPNLKEVWSISGPRERVSEAVLAKYAARGITIESCD